MRKNWHTITNAPDVPSPALLVYPDRVEENIRRMIAIAGGVERLRPHLKTHKLAEVVRMQTAQGIAKFKCATIAEAEMVAGCRAPDVLLAYQPVGPNVGRFIQLAKNFPGTKFSTIADDAPAIRALSEAARAAGLGSARGSRAPVGGPPTGTAQLESVEDAASGSSQTLEGFAASRRETHAGGVCSPELEVLLDIDCGQHRTGVAPGPKAIELYRLIDSLPGLKPGGLHVYDGHIHEADLATRTKNCAAAFAPVNALRQELTQAGLPVPRMVAGGTPTFPIHARRPDVECSPGTCIFWDAGYATKLPDLDFLPAALVLTRVVSKPGDQLLCLDLGHKAIASENPHPRVQFLNLPDAKAVSHSEEHLVVETAKAKEFAVGDCLYGIPWHICPTVALHGEAVVVENGQAGARWKIVARDRRLTI
jgi:D-serine deaminase-like pyridoxal phosphate-dependent protein